MEIIVTRQHVERYIEHNDRGDEDDRERPQWTVVVTLDANIMDAVHRLDVTSTVSI